MPPSSGNCFGSHSKLKAFTMALELIYQVVYNQVLTISSFCGLFLCPCRILFRPSIPQVHLCLASITLDKVERELRAVVGVDKEAANINHNADQEKIKGLGRSTLKVLMTDSLRPNTFSLSYSLMYSSN
ncbi:hypothetical protein ABKV19_008599 [Rosa sericea]